MATLKLLLSSRLVVLFRRWARCIRTRRQQAHARLELNGMTDHELNDLGIGRSQIRAQAGSAEDYTHTRNQRTLETVRKRNM